MTEKNKLEQVSKEMMKELEDVKTACVSPRIVLSHIRNDDDKVVQYPKITNWYNDSNDTPINDQLKLIKHIWLNDPQFEEEKPKKYVVRIKNASAPYSYLKVLDLGFDMMLYKQNATKFDTREEAEKWVNPQMEVVEVEE